MTSTFHVSLKGEHRNISKSSPVLGMLNTMLKGGHDVVRGIYKYIALKEFL